jgi:hypothetical protein
MGAREYVGWLSNYCRFQKCCKSLARPKDCFAGGAKSGGAASLRRVGTLPAFERLLRLKTMISTLKKRREGQIYTDTITLSDLNAYYPRHGRIQLSTAFCQHRQFWVAPRICNTFGNDNTMTPNQD